MPRISLPPTGLTAFAPFLNEDACAIGSKFINLPRMMKIGKDGKPFVPDAVASAHSRTMRMDLHVNSAAAIANVPISARNDEVAAGNKGLGMSRTQKSGRLIRVVSDEDLVRISKARADLAPVMDAKDEVPVDLVPA